MFICLPFFSCYLLIKKEYLILSEVSFRKRNFKWVHELKYQEKLSRHRRQRRTLKRFVKYSQVVCSTDSFRIRNKLKIPEPTNKPKVDKDYDNKACLLSFKEYLINLPSSLWFLLFSWTGYTQHMYGLEMNIKYSDREHKRKILQFPLCVLWISILMSFDLLSLV